MNDALVLDTIRLVVPLVFLAYFTWEDVRERRITDIVVYVYGVVAIASLASYTYYLLSTWYASLIPVYLVPLAVVVAVSVLLWLMGVWAEGDAWVFAETGIVLAYPYTALFPGKSYPPLIYYLFSMSMISMLMVVAKTLANTRYLDMMRGWSIGDRIALLIGGTPIRARDYVKTKHMLLLTVPVVSDKGVLEGYRVRRKINAEEADDEKDREYVEKLVEEKIISPDTVLWVTKGIPFTAVILASYTASFPLLILSP